METVCDNCASGLEEETVVCVHCGSAVNTGDVLGSKPAQEPGPQENFAPTSAPPPAPAEPKLMFAAGDDLAGIGGWLILVAVGLVIGPFFRLHGMIIDAGYLFGNRYQAAMTARPGVQAIIFYELVTNSFFFAFLLLLNFLFYRRRHSFPTFMIINLGAQLLTQLIDHLWAMQFSHSAQWTQVLQSLVTAVVWIPYMLNSLRVEQTFVN